MMRDKTLAVLYTACKCQRDEKCSEQSKCSSDVLECSDKESQKKVQKVESVSFLYLKPFLPYNIFKNLVLLEFAILCFKIFEVPNVVAIWRINV